MSGVVSGFGGPINTTWFTDTDTQPGSSRLAAVVIWRRPTAAVSSDSEVAATPWQAPDGWDGARSDDGREVLYHSERRVVRVLEREYPLPSTDQALLLLIEELSPGTSPPAVGVHTLSAPVHVRPQIDRALDKPARIELMRAASRAEHATWNTAIAAHPAVHAFLATGSGS